MIATDVRNRFVTTSRTQRIADRWNAVYPAQPVDGGRRERADSEENERGAAR
jgi:hypothetical protein